MQREEESTSNKETSVDARFRGSFDWNRVFNLFEPERGFQTLELEEVFQENTIMTPSLRFRSRLRPADFIGTRV